MELIYKMLEQRDEKNLELLEKINQLQNEIASLKEELSFEKRKTIGREDR